MLVKINAQWFRLYKRRMDPDYFSNMKTYLGELIAEAGGNDKIGVYLKS